MGRHSSGCVDETYEQSDQTRKDGNSVRSLFIFVLPSTFSALFMDGTSVFVLSAFLAVFMDGNSE